MKKHKKDWIFYLRNLTIFMFLIQIKEPLDNCHDYIQAK
jgi:hypothetical protein